jgi:hypothetical protein
LNGSYTVFREVQKFRQWWVWVIVLFVGTIAWYGGVQQILLKRPFGNNPAPDGVMIMLWGIFGVLFPVLFLSLKLITEVRSDGLYVHFFPLQFHTHKISFEEIESYDIRQYSAMKEYGGYGIRYGKSGKAYNISGNRGLQLQFRDGKSLLIGSQRSEEFVMALESTSGIRRKTTADAP